MSEEINCFSKVLCKKYNSQDLKEPGTHLKLIHLLPTLLLSELTQTPSFLTLGYRASVSEYKECSVIAVTLKTRQRTSGNGIPQL